MGGQELAVKFKDLESTCEKLTEENERMKREVYDLQVIIIMFIHQHVIIMFF